MCFFTGALLQELDKGFLFSMFKRALSRLLMENSDVLITRANVLEAIIIPAYNESFCGPSAQAVVLKAFQMTGMSVFFDSFFLFYFFL